MTRHADIHLAYPNLHRKVVLLALHIRESLPEGDERNRAQAIYDRLWQAMRDDEVSEEGYPDAETEPKRSFPDPLNPEIEIEERDHYVVTPEGDRIEWTATARRPVRSGTAPRADSVAPVRAAETLRAALVHLERVRELAKDLATEQTPLAAALLGGLMLQVDETGDFIEAQIELPEEDRGAIPGTVLSHLEQFKWIVDKLIELGVPRDLQDFANELWDLIEPWFGRIS